MYTTSTACPTFGYSLWFSNVYHVFSYFLLFCNWFSDQTDVVSFPRICTASRTFASFGYSLRLSHFLNHVYPISHYGYSLFPFHSILICNTSVLFIFFWRVAHFLKGLNNLLPCLLKTPIMAILSFHFNSILICNISVLLIFFWSVDYFIWGLIYAIQCLFNHLTIFHLALSFHHFISNY